MSVTFIIDIQQSSPYHGPYLYGFPVIQGLVPSLLLYAAFSFLTRTACFNKALVMFKCSGLQTNTFTLLHFFSKYPDL